MNIYVGNLSFNTTEADLREAFEAFGTVEKAAIITDKFTGQSRGFGFVEMPNKEEAMKALGKHYEPVTYEGAGHGFMRSGEEPEATEPNRKARDDGWKRWKELLGKL